jgi:hypothetical protein
LITYSSLAVSSKGLTPTQIGKWVSEGERIDLLVVDCANSAVVMIDFLVRHGVVTVENEEGFVEMGMRMHRRLPFYTFDKSA